MCRLILPHRNLATLGSMLLMKCKVMAITLSTQIPQLLFSSAIPDLAINTDGDGEVEIALTSAGATVFTASHFPYNRQIKVFDLRSVVEMFMRE